MNAPVHDHPALAGLRVFERGWLSSNNILVQAAEGEEGATLIDSGHVNHAAQTLALLRHALGEAPLARIVNTHLHSDHCGGNATLARALGARITIPPGLAEAVRMWEAGALSYEATGQRCERFEVHDTLHPGELLHAGGRRFEALAAPGHDPDSVMLFDAANGLLISADALWEQGFGVVFPEMDGEPGFDDVGAVLDAIAALSVKLVVPGHGAPFTDVGAALARSRSRLASFRAEPARHAKHGVKVLIKYHLMEVRRQALDELLDWGQGLWLVAELWSRLDPQPAASLRDWLQQLAEQLLQQGALARQGDQLLDV